MVFATSLLFRFPASLDLKQMRQSGIVTVLRKTLGLPPIMDGAPEENEDQPLRFVVSTFASLALVLSSSTVANADSLAIHFETSEGYTTGSIDGQNGWAGRLR